MIKRFWQKITKKAEMTDATHHVFSREEHQVSRKKISKNALKVLFRLNEAGYQAYLVGGGVRDILLGLSPKDFDIATDATPEEVSQLFRNCRLIGRRFRLAHIMFGREIIEVATFRASHHDSCHQSAKVSERGMLVRDNVYGSLEEDAQRRDFTVNALYYSSKDFTVIDQVGGYEDLKQGQLRLIGDPVSRYTEDPVRILRAVRLSVKLGLSIEEKTAAPIAKMANNLEHVSPARLWDESNKLFLAGHANKTWQALVEFGVARHLFSQTCLSLNDKSHAFQAFVTSALKNTDKRIANQQPVTPAFLFAVFLWQPLLVRTEKLQTKGLSRQEALHKAATQVLDIQRKSISIPKRFSIIMREIWSLQHRFLNRKKRNVESLTSHPKFRAAYDFLCLRAPGDSALEEAAQWWTQFQEVSSEQQAKMIRSASNDNNGSRSSNRRRRRKPAAPNGRPKRQRYRSNKQG